MFIDDLAKDALAGKFVVSNKKAARGLAMKNQSIQEQTDFGMALFAFNLSISLY